ncbi:hypothetical protein HanPSC8_Chr11g0486691 [Helianthus annuus]|nr:hypothetical protein HanPSC8_Chr11g0486691 [Helianthus annuus]
MVKSGFCPNQFGIGFDQFETRVITGLKVWVTNRFQPYSSCPYRVQLIGFNLGSKPVWVNDSTSESAWPLHNI